MIQFSKEKHEVSEKQLSTKATMDAFDEIYTNFDLSVDETYTAQQGVPFDYPTRWLNDPSMNKRIAIRRLDITPSSHTFRLRVRAQINETFHITITGPNGDPQTEEKSFEWYEFIVDVTITEYDNLNKIMDHLIRSCEYELGNEHLRGGLQYDYSNKDNEIHFGFINSKGDAVNFSFLSNTDDGGDNVELVEFLKLLNQPLTDEAYNLCKSPSQYKVFTEVWNRDRMHFHASFSTSRRKFIGKRGDFYHNLTLLYPPPTNESSFYIRFTSNGMKNILLRYCEFDIQLCFIVNYKKTSVL